jgi:nicotinate-nucleotide pyrophosphorylase (carboxylating)
MNIIQTENKRLEQMVDTILYHKKALCTLKPEIVNINTIVEDAIQIVQTLLKKKEGEIIHNGDIIMEIEGDARSILSLERTILNFLMRMSGIATLTMETLNKIRKVNKNIILAGTRKTTPGLQLFEKNAVKAGGGDTHRFRLDDCVLIKDNHIAVVGNIKESLIKARKNVSFTKKIEIEVENLHDAISAAQNGADIIMLDNMEPAEVKKVLSSLEEENLRENVMIEVSGGINPDNIVEYAKTSVDIISTGYITHSAKALNMSLELIMK